MVPGYIVSVADPLPSPGKIEPADDKCGECEPPGQDRPADAIALELFERLLRDHRIDQPVGRRPIFAAIRGAEQDRVVRPRRGVGLEVCLNELGKDEALIGIRFFEGVPDGADDLDAEPGEGGLEEDLGGHPDIVDDGLAAARPAAERVVAEDAHDDAPPPRAGRSPAVISPRSRSSRFVSSIPFASDLGARAPTSDARIASTWMPVA